MKLVYFLTILLISIGAHAELDLSSVDRNIDTVKIPKIKASEVIDKNTLPFGFLNFDEIPNTVEPIVLPEKQFVTRGTGRNVYRQVSPSVVKIITQESSGSGVIVSKEGLIVTNWHVTTGYTKVGVILLSDSKKNPRNPKYYLADVIKSDPKVDLSIIKMEEVPYSLTPVIFGRIPSIGSEVHAIGHPEGKDWTYTKGYISQIRNNYFWEYISKSNY